MIKRRLTGWCGFGSVLVLIGLMCKYIAIDEAYAACNDEAQNEWNLTISSITTVPSPACVAVGQDVSITAKADAEVTGSYPAYTYGWMFVDAGVGVLIGSAAPYGSACTLTRSWSNQGQRNVIFHAWDTPHDKDPPNSDYCMATALIPIRVVKLAQVEYKWGSYDWKVVDASVIYVPVGKTIEFRATPDPAGDWPVGKPTWNQNNSGATYSTSFSELGAKQVTVECGNPIVANLYIYKVEIKAEDGSGTPETAIPVTKVEKYKAVVTPSALTVSDTDFIWSSASSKMDTTDLNKQTCTVTAGAAASSAALAETIQVVFTPQGSGQASDPVLHSLTVLKVEMVQYGQSGGTWSDVSDTLYVLKGSVVTFKAVPAPLMAWPGGLPIWGGTSGASGVGETKTVTFDVLSSSLVDFQTITATCGNTKTVNVVVYEVLGTTIPDDNFSGRSQGTYGLEETVNLDFTTAPGGISAIQAGGLEWTIDSGVGAVSSAGVDGNADYDARHVAGNVILHLTIISGPSEGQFKSYTKTVIAPSGTRMTRTSSNVKHILNYASAGIELFYWLDPKDVSFNKLTFGEGSCPASNVSGFFLKCIPWNSYPTGSIQSGHAENYFGQIFGGNILTGCRVGGVDHSNTGTANPFAAGSYTWDIPTHYIDDTGARHAFGANSCSVGTFEANGRATKTKAGESGSAALSDPTAGW